MDMKVSFKSAENHRGKICLSKEDTGKVKNVWDVKLVLQDKILAPACDQKLFYQGRLLENTRTLKDLYLRSGDELEMAYLASGNLENISSLASLLQEFLDEISKLGFDDMQVDEIPIEDGYLLTDSAINYTHLMDSMENVGFDCFIPWKSLKTQANHHFFVQNGGFDNFIKVLRFSRRIFIIPGLDKESFSLKYNVLISLCNEWNFNQMRLQLKCLSLLWNFSETAENRLLLLEQGGLSDVMDALTREAPSNLLISDLMQEQLHIYSEAINEAAVGCLVQYVEFAKAQEIVTDNEAVMNKLILMAESSLDYSLYTSQIAANTLFCCSGNPNTPKRIVKNGLHREVIQSVQEQFNAEFGDMPIQYFSCMFLGQIRACPGVDICDEEKYQIDRILEMFLDRYEAYDVADWENEHSYVWISMLPFIHLAFSGGPPPSNLSKEDAELNSVSEISVHNSETYKLGCDDSSTASASNQFADCCGCTAPLHRSELLIQSGSINTKNIMYVAIPEEMRVDQGHKKKKLVDSQQTTVICPSFEPNPSTSGDKSPHWPGSVTAQRLGVFSILQLLHSPENAKVMEQEGLLGFLTCLAWFLPEEESNELIQCFHKTFGPQNVPSLKILSKSVLARVHGFYSAITL